MQSGELLIVGFHGKVIPSWLKDLAKNHGIGGVILFDYYCQTKTYENNIESPAQVKELCAEIHSLPSNPLIFIDQEGGLVRRLKDKKGFKPLPSQKEFNLLPEEEKKQILFESYSELKDLGINYNFAPVIDVDYNPENPNIGKIKRAYSADIKEVEKNALLVSEIASKIGVGLSLKHYPGIGGANVDSHEELMDLSNALNQEQEELFYKLAPKIFGNAIVISHAIIKQWDEKFPITLSAAALKRIRKNLPETLLISDDMQMQGLQRAMGTKAGTIAALKAGMDIICIGNNLINDEDKILGIAEEIKKSAHDKILNSAELEKSISRVQQRKKLLRNN